MNDKKEEIFAINNENAFVELALAVFKWQAKNNDVYRRYIETLKIDPSKVTQLNQIPFLPIGFFKEHKVEVGLGIGKANPVVFESSGTTGTVNSKHYVNDIALYEESFKKGFEHFYGNVEDYCILALLPSYLERDNSSLVYMTKELIKDSKHKMSGFYLRNHQDLLNTIKELNGQKILLIGVTFALLDLLDFMHEKSNTSINFDDVIILETGGMKGKRKELIREELHEILCKGFHKKQIHSEYGMTELLSQAYSQGNGIFNCPPWMKVITRDVNDPFALLANNRTGGINVIDLANLNSCSFIATQDLGKVHNDGSFEVLGRFDNSDVRGCNLLVE